MGTDAQSTTNPPANIIDQRLHDVQQSLRKLSIDCTRLADDIDIASRLEANLEQLELARRILRDARSQATFDDSTTRRAVVADIARGMTVFVAGETPLGRWWVVEDIKPHWTRYPNLVTVVFSTGPGCVMELMLNVDDPVRVKR